MSNTSANATEDVARHLTNFALLVDIRTRVEGKPTEDVGLEVLTYIGAVFSMIGTLITILTYIGFRKLRRRDASKFHISLCIAIFFMLLFFLVGIEQTENEVLCTVMSLVIQYFTLASVMWMGAEAVLLFDNTVIVFRRISRRYYVVVSLICWLTPLILLVVSLATLGTGKNTLIYFRQDENKTFGEEAVLEFCFISDLGVFFGTFLAPILLIMIVNLVIFVFVIRALIKHSNIIVRITRKNLKRKNEQSITKYTIKTIVTITGFIVILGLTWIFGALTISGASKTFQYIFVITNSFQGFIIFLLLCVYGSREEWINLLCRQRSKLAAKWHGIFKSQGYSIQNYSPRQDFEAYHGTHLVITAAEDHQYTYKLHSPSTTPQTSTDDLSSSYKVDTLIAGTDISDESSV